ncbi:MAG TPA: GNAT family N-acetyltransferase, partial [Allocoleopsis sp.]
MAILTMRPYQGERDLQPIANLLNTCEAFDREDIYHSVEGLQFEFSHPKFDPTQDLRLWQDCNGQLLAFAQLWIPDESVSVADGHLWFSVHPTHRNQGLESEVIAWAETRLRQVAQLRGLPAQLMVGCRDYQRDRIALFEKHQFSYERCFLRMRRSLAEPIPAAQLPAGF